MEEGQNSIGKLDQSASNIAESITQPLTQPLNAENSKQPCAVCGQLTENKHMHYGAFSCLSCRAFFRRCHQKSTKQGFIKECKSNGECSIANEDRKRCQKCR